MDIRSVKEYLGASWKSVVERIKSALDSDIDLLNVTNASILSNSGKQLRPLLALMFARACSSGEVSETTIRYAAAAELLHNATLLHDDVADYFRLCMNHAFSNKMKKVTFIHGVGQGILKDEIVKELKQYDNIHFFD
ncbi:MAG: polyprenyl synthetase family protein, partial [Bacteroidales bacterium]|nr:polyprenyl synthetase family protein [Bacteroidales bacterium]